LGEENGVRGGLFWICISVKRVVDSLRACDHDFRGFDDDIRGVALFQFQFVSAFPRDDRLDQTLADANRNVSP